MQDDIDFVIPWVDGSDPEWQKQRELCRRDEEKASITSGVSRYRDWGTLPYWFRAVEKYAPWVRRIHFITCGQVPEWLNLNHPKLHFVRHEDYIPRKWLPTFSANPIELNMHRIEGLAEKFVYFNDDTFLNAPVRPEDFFRDGLPCTCAGFHPGPAALFGQGGHFVVNDLTLIAKHFKFRESFRKNFTKFLRLRYGSVLLKTLYMLPVWWAAKNCRGFHTPHSAEAYLKSTFIEIWDKEKDYLEDTSSHRFRDKSDVNQYLMYYWQLMSGKFHPRSASFSAVYLTERMQGKGAGKLDVLTDDIKCQRHGLICINDDDYDADDIGFSEDPEELFRIVSGKVLEAYRETFPEKSSFEL